MKSTTESEKIITSTTFLQIKSSTIKPVFDETLTTQNLKESSTLASTKNRSKTTIKIVDRHIFNAPEKCFDGFGFARGRCRKIYDALK